MKIRMTLELEFSGPAGGPYSGNHAPELAVAMLNALTGYTSPSNRPQSGRVVAVRELPEPVAMPTATPEHET